MVVLFTGVSSFSGAWFARTLAAAGHEVVATLTKELLGEYEPLRRSRVQWALKAGRVHGVFGVRFGTNEFRHLVRHHHPRVLCHHGAIVTDYKSAGFDTREAVEANTRGLDEVLDDLRSQGGGAVVATGTYFEADEGAGTEPRVAFSPYARSKTETWNRIRQAGEAHGLKVGKYVLPNPVGAGEEPRFARYLVETWRKGREAVVKHPRYIRDNAPISLLASDYAEFVAQVVTTSPTVASRNPSGWVESNEAFARRVAAEVSRRAGWECRVECAEQTEFSEPLDRHNTSRLSGMERPDEIGAFWDDYAAFLLRSLPLIGDGEPG